MCYVKQAAKSSWTIARYDPSDDAEELNNFDGGSKHCYFVFPTSETPINEISKSLPMKTILHMKDFRIFVEDCRGYIACMSPKEQVWGCTYLRV